MLGVPDPVYRAHVAPRLLAASAELVLDALPPFAAGERILEAESGLGLVTHVVNKRAVEAEAELWVCDANPAHLSALGRLGGVRVAVCGGIGDLPIADDSVDVVVVNGLSGLRHLFSAALRDVRRVLKPAGVLVATSFVSGTFEELHDLLLESLESRGEGELSRQLAEARAQRIDEKALRDVVRKVGFELDVYGEEERTVFPRGPLVQDPLFTVVAPYQWLGAAPPLPWDAVAEASRTYFGDEPFGVRVRTGVIRARAV